MTRDVSLPVISLSLDICLVVFDVLLVLAGIRGGISSSCTLAGRLEYIMFTIDYSRWTLPHRLEYMMLTTSNTLCTYKGVNTCYTLIAIKISFKAPW